MYFPYLTFPSFLPWIWEIFSDLRAKRRRSQRRWSLQRTWPASLISPWILLQLPLQWGCQSESSPCTSNDIFTLRINFPQVVLGPSQPPIWVPLAALSVRMHLHWKRTHFTPTQSRTFPRTPLCRTLDHCLMSSPWLPYQLSPQSRRWWLSRTLNVKKEDVF